jgi:hypothetical protein
LYGVSHFIDDFREDALRRDGRWETDGGPRREDEEVAA